MVSVVYLDLVNSFTLAKGHGLLQYRTHTAKRCGRLVRAPLPYIHDLDTWLSGTSFTVLSYISVDRFTEMIKIMLLRRISREAESGGSGVAGGGGGGRGQEYN